MEAVMQVKTVSFEKHKRMGVVQLLSSDPNTLDFLSGPSAVDQELINVKEVSDSGSVNNIYVFNLSDKYVFFMDGDIIMGAKQNRVINTSVLLAPNSKTTLPVSCVEQGRWESRSSHFKSTDYIAPQKLRANKAQSVKQSREKNSTAYADQGIVWNNVSAYSELLNVHSATDNIRDVYEEVKVDLESFLNQFNPEENANGVAIFTDDNLLSIDLFNRTEIYKEYFPKIIKSAAMEIVHLEKKESKLTKAEAEYKTVTLFDKLEGVEYSTHPGVGVGEEKRFETDEVTGFELNFKKHLVHFTALNLEKRKGSSRSGNRWIRI
jgi:hypothetical protein